MTPARLRICRFEPGTVFGGELVGALERMQAGGQEELLDALFVLRDESGEAFDAVDLAAGAADRTFAALLDFRLDPGRRRALTRRTLAAHRGGVPADVVEALGASLPAGAALLATLHRGGPATLLAEAVGLCGGRTLADEPAEATRLGPLGPRLRAVVGC